MREHRLENDRPVLRRQMRMRLTVRKVLLKEQKEKRLHKILVQCVMPRPQAVLQVVQLALAPELLEEQVLLREQDLAPQVVPEAELVELLRVAAPVLVQQQGQAHQAEGLHPAEPHRVVQEAALHLQVHQLPVLAAALQSERLQAQVQLPAQLLVPHGEAQPLDAVKKNLIREQGSSQL